jgi:hypothetical protein
VNSQIERERGTHRFTSYHHVFETDRGQRHQATFDPTGEQ